MFLSFFIGYGLSQFQNNSTDKEYFLGNNAISWKTAMFSIVATETSLLTFMSLPGIGFREDNLFFLQLAFGYIIGRILSAYFLIPMYHRSHVISIYQLIGEKFDNKIQKLSSIIFLITRLLADGVRFLLTAIVIQQILGISIEYCILIIGFVTLVYSIFGGVKTIIKIDSIQFFIYVFGGLFTIIYIFQVSNINFYDSISVFFDRDIFKVSSDESSFIYDSYFFFNALIGGVLLSFCSHGIDYMMVQRSLCTKDIKSAQKSMIGSGFLVFIQFVIFLFVGYLLSQFYLFQNVDINKDREFAYFIINDLPVGMKGLLVAGVLSAAMSTLSSSINSLSSSSIIDLKINFGDKTKLYIGIFWSILLMSIALLFDEGDDALIITGIKIASFTYGILLSLFILVKINKKFSNFSLLAGMVIGFLSVLMSSFYGVAWTLLILIAFFINISTVFIIYFLQNKLSKSSRYLVLMILLQIFSIFFIFNYLGSKPINYGIDLTEDYLSLVKDKNIAILANKSSVDKNGKNIVDILNSQADIKLIKIFSPEHGFKANLSAGEHIDDSNYYDINVISLYGSNKKPSTNDLNNIDVIIIDIQDIGSSYYTYLSTVTYMLEAAAENDISVIVLDRPNPIGRTIYGPIKEKFNFIGMHPIPIRHGMTIGELCNMINDEGWLTNQITVKDLKIIKMDDYPDDDEHHNWTPPSPNIPNKKTAFIYNGICLFEGTNISEGRGTSSPFKYIGAPWIDSDHLMNYVNILKKQRYDSKIRVKKIEFIPKSNKGSKSPKYENEICYGISIELDKTIEPIEFSLYLLKYFYNNYEDFSFNVDFFDILYGSSDFRGCLENNCDMQKILNDINKDRIEFNELRKNYLLY